MSAVEGVHADTGGLVKITGTHPVADLFPMLDAEDLADLVASIKSDGQHHPIVLDAKRRVLDGRNRLAACEQAGVKPTVVFYEGDDPNGYALAVNVSRRSLSKGQKAMMVARFVSETETGLSREERKQLAAKYKVSTGRVGQASTVTKHAPDLADAVVSGAQSLDAAYKTARERKTDAESAEKRMADLRDSRPDLADQVTEESLTLVEALAAMRADEAQRESERRAGEQCIRSVLTYLTSESITPSRLAQNYADVLDQFDTAQINFAASTMAAIAELKNEEHQ